MVAGPDARVERLDVSVFTIPTDRPESDGTLEWTSTTMVIVEALSNGRRGLGYTYSDASVAQLISGRLASVVEGMPAFDVPGAWMAVVGSLRNAGARGPGAMAIGAVDAALWDLKARLVEIP